MSSTIIERELEVADISTKPALLLSDVSGLSQQQIKRAMKAGAVWLLRNGRKQRLRRGDKPLQAGDRLQLNYNSEILSQEAVAPELIADRGDYSVWFKPFGVPCQGSRWGDFSTIQRQVELKLQRPCMLVHRLDRATSGVMVLTHSKQAARAFSQMFEQRAEGLEKHYRALVRGNAAELGADQLLDDELDGKPARTRVTYVESDVDRDCSLLAIRLETGRKHQIRQHLASAGLPIVGDRLYGGGETETEDLQLQACELKFICPFNSQAEAFHVPEEKLLRL